MSKKNKNVKIVRTFPQFNDETFKKIQKIQSVLADNLEVARAYQDSIVVHTKGRELMRGHNDVLPLVENFEGVISAHTKSRDNLLKFNTEISPIIEELKTIQDHSQIELIEKLFKLINF